MLLILSFRRADPLQYVRKRKKYTQRQLSFHRGQTGGFYRKKPGKWKIIYRFAQSLLTNAGNSAIVNFVRSTKECWITLLSQPKRNWRWYVRLPMATVNPPESLSILLLWYCETAFATPRTDAGREGVLHHGDCGIVKKL